MMMMMMIIYDDDDDDDDENDPNETCKFRSSRSGHEATYTHTYHIISYHIISYHIILYYIILFIYIYIYTIETMMIKMVCIHLVPGKCCESLDFGVQLHNQLSAFVVSCTMKFL